MAPHALGGIEIGDTAFDGAGRAAEDEAAVGDGQAVAASRAKA